MKTYLPIKQDLTQVQIDNTKKLIEALRSGEYHQIDGYLKRTQEVNGKRILCHCCLGVGCEIFNIQNKERSNQEYDDVAYVFYFEGRDHISLPDQGWWHKNYGWGVNMEFKWDTGNESSEGLYDINDNGKTFEEIASLIEAVVIERKEFCFR